MTGRLVAIVGPSGAGKDTLISALAAQMPDMVLVRRAITRPAEAGGEDHLPMTEAAFETARANGAFMVDWSAHGLRYGIPYSALAQVAEGRLVLFNGSRAALEAARAVFPALEIIMITAPADVLAARLAARGRESHADIAARLARAAPQVPLGARVVVNDGTLEEGVARLRAALSPAAAGV